MKKELSPSTTRPKATAQLKSKLASGEPVGNALRAMFHDEGFGLMELYRALSDVQGISKKDAMRIVVHETESWGGRRGAAARTMNNPKSK